jgi:hypothetical protein
MSRVGIVFFWEAINWKKNCVKCCTSVTRHALAQLVETLRYKPEGSGFNSRWCHWNFSLTGSFWQNYGVGRLSL